MIQSALIGPFFCTWLHIIIPVYPNFVTIYDYPGKRAGWLWEF